MEEKMCWNCGWRGSGEEVCDEEYCYFHGITIRRYMPACEMWVNERGIKDGKTDEH